MAKAKKRTSTDSAAGSDDRLVNWLKDHFVLDGLVEVQQHPSMGSVANCLWRHLLLFLMWSRPEYRAVAEPTVEHGPYWWKRSHLWRDEARDQSAWPTHLNGYAPVLLPYLFEVCSSGHLWANLQEDNWTGHDTQVPPNLTAPPQSSPLTMNWRLHPDAGDVMEASADVTLDQVAEGAGVEVSPGIAWSTFITPLVYPTDLHDYGWRCYEVPGDLDLPGLPPDGRNYLKQMAALSPAVAWDYPLRLYATARFLDMSGHMLTSDIAPITSASNQSQTPAPQELAALDALSTVATSATSSDDDINERAGSTGRPLADDAQLTITYAGHVCQFHSKQCYRLISRLVKARGTYVSHDELRKYVVPDAPISNDALRQTKSRAVKQLKAAGIVELAKHIRSAGPGYYYLKL